ncbi:hypothetical protein AQUCO_00900033v1 [Aquilegia coerulea]|uniref:Uncharacterized protein n=1 Tax=Aquilegia coerulea TaxID=218851 RepID=A0A2G5EBR6_AQUCA|nr:hypothetical protein AQUCO_00900033v1 [Aquilegia coerulea]
MKFYSPQSLGGHQHAHINNQKMKDYMRLQAANYHPYYPASRLHYGMDGPSSPIPNGSSRTCRGGLQMQPGFEMPAPYHPILSPVRSGRIQDGPAELIGRSFMGQYHSSGGSQEIPWGLRFNTSPTSQSLSDSFARTNGFSNTPSASGSREMPRVLRFSNNTTYQGLSNSFAGMNGFATNRRTDDVDSIVGVGEFTNDVYYTFDSSPPKTNDVDSTQGARLPPPSVNVVGFRPWASGHTGVQPLASKGFNINSKKQDGGLENSPKDPKPPEEDSAELDLTLRL